MCHGVQKRLSVRIFGPSKSFCRLFLWKKQPQKSKVPKNALILDLLQHANIPSASSVFLPTEKSTEGACNQRNAVLLADFEGEMPGAALRFSRRNIFTDFRGFFSFWVTPETSTEAKGMSFQSSCKFFFFWGGWDMIYFHYI